MDLDLSGVTPEEWKQIEKEIARAYALAVSQQVAYGDKALGILSIAVGYSMAIDENQKEAGRGMTFGDVVKLFRYGYDHHAELLRHGDPVPMEDVLADLKTKTIDA